MNRINFHRGTFLEKEELNRMFKFLQEDSISSAIISATKRFGLVSPGGIAGEPFKVTNVGNTGGVKVVGGHVISPELKALYLKGEDSFLVPNDSQFYWIKISPYTRNREEGYVQVDTTGNVSGTVNFKGIIRGQSSGVPTCVRFVKDDGSEPLNKYVYQVVDIVNDNNIILSSGVQFQQENNLRVIVLGSIPMGERFTDEQLEGLYTFEGYEISLVEEVSIDTPPSKESNEYYLARVKNTGGTVSVTDKRTEFWSLT